MKKNPSGDDGSAHSARSGSDRPSCDPTDAGFRLLPMALIGAKSIADLDRSYVSF